MPHSVHTLGRTRHTGSDGLVSSSRLKKTLLVLAGVGLEDLHVYASWADRVAGFHSLLRQPRSFTAELIFTNLLTKSQATPTGVYLVEFTEAKYSLVTGRNFSSLVLRFLKEGHGTISMWARGGGRKTKKEDP